jgi:hypothetical protein
VQYVSELAASSFSPTKNYDARVFVTEIPAGVQLKPGMTAEVEINVGRYEDVIAVPVGAVTEHFGQSYAYAVKESDVERRRVTIGRATHSHLEITEGLSEGDVVALDAYQRGLADFADSEREVEKLQGPKPPGSGGAAGGAAATEAPPAAPSSEVPGDGPSDAVPAPSEAAPAAPPSNEAAPATATTNETTSNEAAPTDTPSAAIDTGSK